MMIVNLVWDDSRQLIQACHNTSCLLAEEVHFHHHGNLVCTDSYPSSLDGMTLCFWKQDRLSEKTRQPEERQSCYLTAKGGKSILMIDLDDCQLGKTDPVIICLIVQPVSC